MKSRSTILQLLVCTWLSWAAATFGQDTFFWTNQNPTFPAGGNLGVAGNWTNLSAGANGLANPANPDTAEWAGITTGNLALTLSGGYGGSSGQPGINLYMNSNQTSSLQIGPPAGVNAGTPRMNSILIDAGAGQFILGDNSLNSLEIVWGSAFTQTLENDSSFPAIVMPNLLWRNGGGGTHIWDYKGTGDWWVTNYMRCDNSGNGSGVWKDGPGTMTWVGTNVPNASVPGVIVGAGLNLIDGKLIMKSPDLITTANIQLDTAAAGGTLLLYDAPIGSGTFSGTVSGIGPIQVNSGSLTLSGFNTYTGSNLLTGGELIAGRGENLGVNGPFGVGGTITFRGGTLGYSGANTYDYSPRFDTSAGQAYSVDVPSGQSVTFTNILGSSGGTLTKIGSGTLTLSGSNTYSGTTTVNGGTLIIQGTAGSGNIAVADGQNLGVLEHGTIAPSGLTLGTTTGANLQFFNVTNTTTAPLAVSGAVSAAGPVTVSINSGVFKTIGQTFPLFSWGSGSAPAVNNPPAVSGAAGVLSTNGSTIVLNITDTPYVWVGGTSGTWDTGTSGNWQQSGNALNWQNNVLTLFDDTALGNSNITISGDLLPKSVTINNSLVPYSIASSGGNIIDGSSSLTKVGNGTLVLSGGANAYTGVTTAGGGSLIVSNLANGGSPSDIGAATSAATNLVLNGGTLQYFGGAVTINRLFSVGTSGGVLDSSGTGALALLNTGSVGLSGSGAHALTLTGTLNDTNTLAANIVDSSGGATLLNKTGAGTWILLGTNTYTGLTALHNGGTLQIGNGGASGTIGAGNVSLNNNSSLRFFSTGTVTANGAITGTGALTNDGTGTVILAGNNVYSGDTVINAGKLQLGNGGGSGSLSGTANITNNAMLVFNATGNWLYTGGGIHGTGNVEIKAGTVKNVAANDYTGWTLIDSGATFTPTDNNQGNAGTLSTSVITNNGTFRMEGYITRTPLYANIVGTGKVQVGGTGANFDQGDQVLAGTNTYTGGTFIGETHLMLGDGATPGAGAIVGNVTFVNNFEDAGDGGRRLIFNRPDDFTFSGNITTNFTGAQNNQGIVQQNGPGTITLTGANNYASGTVINAGTIQVGAGGVSGTIGSGPVTDGGMLIFNRSGNLAVPGAVRDGTAPGSLMQVGPGVVTLGTANSAFTNSYTGLTTISNGILAFAGGYVNGDVDIEGGAIASGAIGSVGTLNIAGNMTINSGGVVVTLNKALVQSNSFYNLTNAATLIAGNLTVNGGTLRVTNAGPTLAVGDKFVIFSEPLTNGVGLTVVSPAGFTLANNLAVDGSVTVTAVAQPPAPKLNKIILSGTNVVISGTNNFGSGGSYDLLGTNNLKAPLATWPVVNSGYFDLNGSFVLTNAIGTNAQFFILRAP